MEQLFSLDKDNKQNEVWDMGEHEKIGNAIERAKYITCITILIIAVIAPIFSMFGNRNKRKRIEDLEYNIGLEWFKSEEHTDYSTYKWELEFDDDNKGIWYYHANGVYTDPLNDKTEFTYEGTLNFFGMEYVKVKADGEVFKCKVGRDKDGNIVAVKCNDMLYKTEDLEEDSSIGIIYKNQSLRDIFIMLLVVGICAIGYGIINIFVVKHQCKVDADNEAERFKQEQINLKKSILEKEWINQIIAFGYDENDAIRVSFGNLVWVAKEKFCEAENSKDYIQRYLESDKSEHKIQIEAIPVKDIQYFSKEGDVQYTTRVSGGGGGGSSVGGAIVGGLIAGDAGAVIGSRKQTEAIKSEVVTHDSRKTIIRYYKDNQIFAITYSGFSVYEYLLTKIPEKDLLTIQLNANKNSTSVKQMEESKKVVTAAGNIKEKLETIKNLYDSGLITEEEYAKKKDDILSKI